MSYKVEFLLPFDDDWASNYAAAHYGYRTITVYVEAVPRKGEDVGFTIEGVDESPEYTVSRVGHVLRPGHVMRGIEQVHEIVVTLR